MWERLVLIPEDRVTLRHVPAHLGWSDVDAGILSQRYWEGNLTADEQAKDGSKESEPPQQMMNELCAEETHDPESADGCHIIEWRDCNLDIATKVQFDGCAGGEGEGARQTKANLLYQCKNIDEMKDETLKSAKPCRIEKANPYL